MGSLHSITAKPKSDFLLDQIAKEIEDGRSSGHFPDWKLSTSEDLNDFFVKTQIASLLRQGFMECYHPFRWEISVEIVM